MRDSMRQHAQILLMDEMPEEDKALIDGMIDAINEAVRKVLDRHAAKVKRAIDRLHEAKFSRKRHRIAHMFPTPICRLIAGVVVDVHDKHDIKNGTLRTYVRIRRFGRDYGTALVKTQLDMAKIKKEAIDGQQSSRMRNR